MKIAILITAALFVVAGASAQQNWGVKGGLNIASETAGNQDTNPRTGIHLGFFVECPISKGVDFQPELLYSMQGATYTMGSTNYTDKLDYINVPLMFKIYLTQKRRFSIDIGPQFGYLISAKYTYGSSTVNIYDSDKLQKFDASIGLGVSYKLTDKFDLVFRGTAGLTKIIETMENKNSVIQFGAGYRF